MKSYMSDCNRTLRGYTWPLLVSYQEDCVVEIAVSLLSAKGKGPNGVVRFELEEGEGPTGKEMSL